MRPIRHWVGFGGEEFAIAWANLEAPPVMFGDLHLPYAPLPATVNPPSPGPGTVYSWALNNIWETDGALPPSRVVVPTSVVEYGDR